MRVEHQVAVYVSCSCITIILQTIHAMWITRPPLLRWNGSTTAAATAEVAVAAARFTIVPHLRFNSLLFWLFLIFTNIAFTCWHCLWAVGSRLVHICCTDFRFSLSPTLSTLCIVLDGRLKILLQDIALLAIFIEISFVIMLRKMFGKFRIEWPPQIKHWYYVYWRLFTNVKPFNYTWLGIYFTLSNIHSLTLCLTASLTPRLAKQFMCSFICDEIWLYYMIMGWEKQDQTNYCNNFITFVYLNMALSHYVNSMR